MTEGHRPTPWRRLRGERWLVVLAAFLIFGLAFATWAQLPSRPEGPDRSEAFDRDGDGRADQVSWNPANGQWQVGAHDAVLGPIGAVAVPADWDGDGLVDAATWEPATGTWLLPGRSEITLGSPGDVPVLCDWDGDGSLDPGVWRPSDGGWYHGLDVTMHLGTSGDVPVPGRWGEGNRCTEAVFRPRDGSWPGTGQAEPFGLRGDIPIPADWDGDGTIDRAVWRPTTGAWLVESPTETHIAAYLGRAGDLPVPADWDGDGQADPVVWRPSTGAWIRQSGVMRAHTRHGSIALVASPAVRAMVLQLLPADGSRTRSVAEASPATLWVTAVAAMALITTLWTSRPLRLPRRRDRMRPEPPAAAADSDVPWHLDVVLWAAAFTMPMSVLRIGPTSIANVLLTVLLAGVMLWRRRDGVTGGWLRSEKRTLTCAAVLAVAGGALGEVIASPGAASPHSVARVLFGVAIPLTALTVVPWGIQAIVGAVVAFAAGAVAAVAAGPFRASADGRWMGLTTHPNHLGLVCLLGVAAGIAVTGFPRWKRLGWAFVAANLVGLIQSGSRSALLGLMVLVLSGTWITWLTSGSRTHSLTNSRSVGWRHVRNSALLVLAGTAIWHGAGWARLGGDGASDSARWFRLQLSIERIQRHPLTGEGLAFIEEAHSVPLQLAAAGGILALVGGLLTLSVPLLTARRTLGNHLVRWLCSGWLAYLAAATVQNIVVHCYLWTYAGVVIAAAHCVGDTGRGSLPTPISAEQHDSEVGSMSNEATMVTANES